MPFNSPNANRTLLRIDDSAGHKSTRKEIGRGDRKTTGLVGEASMKLSRRGLLSQSTLAAILCVALIAGESFGGALV